MRRSGALPDHRHKRSSSGDARPPPEALLCTGFRFAFFVERTGAAHVHVKIDLMTQGDAKTDASPLSFSTTGLFLCMEPCHEWGECRNGLLSAQLDGNNGVVYDIECPTDYRQLPGRAHASWTAGVMSEICGQASLRSGMTAFTGTVGPDAERRALDRERPGHLDHHGLPAVDRAPPRHHPGDRSGVDDDPAVALRC